MRLSARLFVSSVVVLLVGAAVSALTVRLLAPQLFDRRMGMMGPGAEMMGGHSGSSVRAAFASALNTALAVGVLASVAAAAVVAVLVTRQVLRPLDAVRAATRQIAAGRYQADIALPSTPELAELASDVNALAHALAATESRRTRLLGEVAHEMRTPLTSLDGYVEGMIDGVFPADRGTLAAVSEELRRLHRLADDLSSLSRTEEGRLDLQLVDADLAELARRAASRLAPQFEDADIRLLVDVPAAVPVHADPDRITQVLTNLLGNALVATPSGGTVSVAARAAGATAELVVSDTGVGLAPEDLERVFERFYRAPGERRSHGSGIGLTIARDIVRAHGGDLTAASDGPGRGARFTVVLPSGADAGVMKVR
ncbi:MAG TPA: HAMP domain-containing sensor histidine kinase [Acidimicrobiales bacterium]